MVAPLLLFNYKRTRSYYVFLGRGWVVSYFFCCRLCCYWYIVTPQPISSLSVSSSIITTSITLSISRYFSPLSLVLSTSYASSSSIFPSQIDISPIWLIIGLVRPVWYPLLCLPLLLITGIIRIYCLHPWIPVWWENCFFPFLLVGGCTVNLWM